MFSMVAAVTPMILVVSLVRLGLAAMSCRTGMRLFTRRQLFSPTRQRQQHDRCKS
jgi:hypothetical protein